MGMNLGLESLHTEEPTTSFEELMVGFVDAEQQFSEEHAIFETIDKLSFFRDYVAENGISDTITAMIGDQISYSSAEELVEKLDVAIEGLISKITGDTIDNTLKQVKEFAEFFLKPYNGQVIASSGMKVKFVDLSEGNPIAPFIAGIGECLDSYFKNKKPTPETVNDLLNKLKGYMTTGTLILRNMKLIDMGYEEYKKAYDEMRKAAKEVKAQYSKLELIKMFAPKKSTADILNKFAKNSVDNGTKDDKQAYRTMNTPAINAKFNSLARDALRIIRVVLAKGYTLVKQIDRDLNKD